MTVLAVTPDILRQGRETLDVAFRIMRTQDSRFGPPQPPLDELHGTTFTPEMVGDMGREPFGEGVFSVDQRLKAAKGLVAAYEANRQRPVHPPVWFKPGLSSVGAKHSARTVNVKALAEAYESPLRRP